MLRTYTFFVSPNLCQGFFGCFGYFSTTVLPQAMILNKIRLNKTLDNFVSSKLRMTGLNCRSYQVMPLLLEYLGPDVWS